MQQTLDTLAANFVIHPLLLLPPVLVLVMVIFRIPALPGLMAAAMLGILSAVFVQGIPAQQMLSTNTGTNL